MQKIRSLVFIGLMFVVPKVFGSLIWQDYNNNQSVNFFKYNTVTVSVTLPTTQKQMFLTSLKNSTEGKANIILIEDAIIHKQLEELGI